MLEKLLEIVMKAFELNICRNSFRNCRQKNQEHKIKCIHVNTYAASIKERTV